MAIAREDKVKTQIEQVKNELEPVRNEQVRKRGLPPLVQSKQRRGQAPLPDLFISDWLYSG